MENAAALTPQLKQAIAAFADQNRKFMERFHDYLVDCGFDGVDNAGAIEDRATDIANERMLGTNIAQDTPEWYEKFDELYDAAFDEAIASVPTSPLESAIIDELFTHLRDQY